MKVFFLSAIRYDFNINMNFSEDTLTGHLQDLVALYVNKYKQQNTIKLKTRQQNERTYRMQIKLKMNNLTEI